MISFVIPKLSYIRSSNSSKIHDAREEVVEERD